MHNKFRMNRCSLLWLAALMLQSGAAVAHPEGHAMSGFAAGFAHPLTGIDHLLAMVAVGLWAAQTGRRAMWVLPALFPMAMVIGAFFAYASVSLPAIEPMIALSVVVLGAAVAMNLRLPTLGAALIVATFAVFHGYAHFSDAPTAQSVTGYGLGFLLATVCLHIVGLVVGTWRSRDARHERMLRLAGSLIAATGAGLLIF